MPPKRPLHIEENNDQIQSKKAKMIQAICACLKNKPVVKLKNIDDMINQKKLFKAIKSQNVTSVEVLLKTKVDAAKRSQLRLSAWKCSVTSPFRGETKSWGVSKKSKCISLSQNGASINL